MENYKYSELTKEIIGCFYSVYDELGFGFLESVYGNALMFELEKRGLEAEKEKELNVHYKGQNVGIFRTDIIVEGKIIIELKATSKLNQLHEVQLVNYLKATKLEIGLLVNFGEKLEFKRKVLSHK